MQPAVVIAIGTTAVLVGLLLAWRFWHKLVPPAPPLAPAPWSALTVFLVVVLFEALPVVVYQILSGTGFFSWWYGPGYPTDPSTVDPAGKQLLQRGNLWAQVLAAPLVLASVAGILARLKVSPRAAGLVTHRPIGDLGLAAVAGLVVTPLAYGIYALVVLVYQLVVLVYQPTPHPLETAARAGLPLADWVVLFLTVAVTAPLLEELLFRGLFQAWMLRHPVGPDVGMVLALVVALGLGYFDWSKGAEPTVFLAPLELVLVLLPVYLALPRLLRGFGAEATLVARAIFSGALLFALAHGNVWPSPVPLFALGLALGWLAHRTRGLLAPVALHALFNTVAFVELVFQPPG